MSTPMIERVALEVWAPQTPDRLVLDAAALDTTAARLGAESTAYGWVPIHAAATELDIVRGSEKSGLEITATPGTLIATLLDAPEHLRPGQPVRAVDLHHGKALFTGKVLDLIVSTERDPDDLARTYQRTTLLGVDEVTPLANTARYGAVIPEYHTWYSYELLPERIDRLLAATGTPYAHQAQPAPSPPRLNRSHALTGQAARWAILQPDQPTEAGHQPAVARLRPGQSWTATPPIDQGITHTTDGVSAGAPSYLGAWIRVTPGPNGPAPTRWRVFHTGSFNEYMTIPLGRWVWVETRTGGTGNLRRLIPVGHTEAPGILDGATRIEILGGLCSAQPTYGHAPLQSLVYESTIARHLDLACNSAGAAWWVDRDGTVQYGHPRGPLVTLSDRARPSYVSITAEWSTAQVANTISLSNNGRIEDPDRPGVYVADNRDLGPWVHPTSVATYGARAAKVPTGLPDVDPIEPYASAPAETARRLLDAAIPTRRPSRVRIHQDPTPVDIELHQPVRVIHDGTAHDLSVLAIEHRITAQTWHTTLTLNRRSTRV